MSCYSCQQKRDIAMVQHIHTGMYTKADRETTMCTLTPNILSGKEGTGSIHTLYVCIQLHAI